ncbi:cytochrome C oxidase subunit IV family protein [Owenweeksia hongkongensis]|uniref:cytochrome C oxidase subunit IV family protein n=1 Tax=Owenweeksia hongkongensis TaxID=253245 RepID=UPI003A94515B
MSHNPNLPSEHHESPEGIWWIWKVFILLLVVTAVEVILGLVKPEFLMGHFMGTSVLNIIFIVLTLVKAFYIVAEFMHVKFERKNLVWTLALPAIILIPYLAFIVLSEGSYMKV